MKTVICHFYNEEFLLPWWLSHHGKIFDHGIMIDYQSTDRSVDLIMEYCPTWEIIKSQNKDFGAFNVDLEIEEIETRIKRGNWRICLNVTEFLYGDFSSINFCYSSQFVIPAIMMISTTHMSYYNHDVPLTNHVTTGVHWKKHNERVGRSFHDFQISYPKPGRHYFVDPQYYTDNFIIFHYGWAPMCDALLDRKLQIQERIPQGDRDACLGWHHIIERQALIQKWKETYIPLAEDMIGHIKFWDHLTFAPKNDISK